MYHVLPIYDMESFYLQLTRNMDEFLIKMDPMLQEPLQGLLELDPRRRPNAQNFSMVSKFERTCDSTTASFESSFSLNCSKIRSRTRR